MPNKTFDELAAETMSPDLIRQSDELARGYLAEMLLTELRVLRGLTEADVAEALGIDGPAVADLERRGDMPVSTLYALVKALGGNLRILASFPDPDVHLVPKAGEATGPKPAWREVALV